MANLSDLTRKEQVLALLRSRVDNDGRPLWVDGPDLANEQVGGSEGLRRLRDLKAEGYLIQERAHPDPRKAIHQYRLVQQVTAMGGTSDRVVMPPPKQAHDAPYQEDAYRQPVRRAAPPTPHAEAKQDRRDWNLISAVRSEYRCEFWIRSPKQRIIGTIALDFDRSRWLWSVKKPKYHGKYGNATPEKYLGGGHVAVEAKSDPLERDAAIRAAREEAKWAVINKVTELKEADSL